jgi:hypothetical protein
MASRAKSLVARQQVVAEVDGKTVIVLEGARFPAGDPIVQANPEQFVPVAPKRGHKR